MSGFGTDAEVMHKASQQVAEVNNNVHSAVQTLQSQIEPLAGVWKGSASAAFQKLMAQFQQNARDITEALQSISDNIASSGQEYSRMEEEHSQSISKIEGMLNG